MATTDTLLGGRADTPSTSYRALPSRSTLLLTVSVVAVAAIAWVLTIRMAGSMSEMVMGLGHVGRRMPMEMMAMEMGVGRFLWMWAVMMTAMMAPAIIPAALAHRLVLTRRGEGATSSAAFVIGFLGVWAIVGVVYLLPFLWFRGLAADAAESWWLPVLAGAVLVLAGAYQFSRRKSHCQGACCAPVTLALEHDAGTGTTSALRTGVDHGIHCLWCCWALMAVLLTVGLMNIVWMIGLSVLFLIEKHSRRGLVVGRFVGVALVVLGLAVMASPDLLHTVSGAATEAPAEPMEPMDMP
jgi:predicted metal-binding membrane protein